jgi:hypothetical protein
MIRSFRRLVASTLLAAIVAFSASPALAGPYYRYYEYDEDPAGVGADTLVLRPLAIVGFFMGVGLFIPAAVTTLLVGQPQNLDKPFDTFIVRPGKFTFVDPIGSH